MLEVVEEEIVDAIARCLRGEQPCNRQEEHKQQLARRAIDKGQKTLSRKQRQNMKDNLPQIQAQRATKREQQKMELLQAKVVELAQRGYLWREVYYRLNLQRKNLCNLPKSV